VKRTIVPLMLTGCVVFALCLCSVEAAMVNKIINFDINGWNPVNDAAPGPSDTFSGAAQIGAPGDFWNSIAVSNNQYTTFTVSNLKLTDGVTVSPVNFTATAAGGGSSFIGADRMNSYNMNALIDDFIFTGGTGSTNINFTFAGLTPDYAYHLYFYGRPGTWAGSYGVFTVGGTTKTSNNGWNGCTAIFLNVLADGSGSITGTVTISSGNGIFNGFQIQGGYPLGPPTNINFDINGYNPAIGEPVPVATNTYSGAAQIGVSGDFWNSISIANTQVATFTVSNLKLPDGVSASIVSFTATAVGGTGRLGADRIDSGHSVNSLIDDYLATDNGSAGSTSIAFTIAGLFPGLAYDLYFYGRAGIWASNGKFTIGGTTLTSGGGWSNSVAAFSGVIADGNGQIRGSLNNVTANGLFNGFQIYGRFELFPRGTVFTIR